MLLLPSLSWSQDTRGTITGTVTDSQQAVVGGAGVTVTNIGTNTTTRLTTNSSGYYEAPLLLPGNYSVTVQMSGFKRYVRSGITLAIGERLQIDVRSRRCWIPVRCLPGARSRTAK